MWTGPAPLRPYDCLSHVRWWHTYMEYGNGIVGDMCMRMFDTVRWILGLGGPKRITSAGGNLRPEGRQVQHLRHPDGRLRVRPIQLRVAAPHLGLGARPGLSVGQMM
jgi:predicted dehydrogenase